MNAYNFSLLFFSFCTFFISLLIWLKREDEIGKRYFLFSCAPAVWGIGLALQINPNFSYDLSLFWSRISSSAAVYIPATWLHFIYVLTKKKPNKPLLYALYAQAIMMNFFFNSPLFLRGVELTVESIRWARVGRLYDVFTFTYFTVNTFAFLLLWKRSKEVSREEKLQLRGFFIATASGFIGGGLTFFPAYGLPVPQYGLYLMPIYPFVMAYFMMKKKLFDEFQMVQAAHRDKLASIGTLATSINHEIRNPLYVIQGLADSFIANLEDGIYKDKDQTIEKSAETMKKASKQATRAMEIMKRFSMFAKERVNETAKMEAVSLSEVFDDIRPLVGHELELKKITFRTDIPKDISPIKVDRRHVEEILFNLIVNACQAMKTNNQAGSIQISAAQHNGSVRVKIEDNGPGIDKDKIKQVFEPFYTTKKEGTGLGLYVTKQLVERNGGKIAIASQLGKGTTFNLEFKR